MPRGGIIRVLVDDIPRLVKSLHAKGISHEAAFAVEPTLLPIVVEPHVHIGPEVLLGRVSFI